MKVAIYKGEILKAPAAQAIASLRKEEPDNVDAQESEAQARDARAHERQGDQGQLRSLREYGLVAMEPSWVTSNQIEAARIAMTRYMKRGGKV